MRPRISFFAFEATSVKILSLDQLKKRDWRISNRCYLCKEEEEQVTISSFIVRKLFFCGS